MPCLYCGKRVPLVRQISDRDFCSEDHRTRYRKLANSVLDRLGGPLDGLNAGDSERAPGKAGGGVRGAAPAGPLPSWACFQMNALAAPARAVRPAISAGPVLPQSGLRVLGPEDEVPEAAPPAAAGPVAKRVSHPLPASRPLAADFGAESRPGSRGAALATLPALASESHLRRLARGMVSRPGTPGRAEFSASARIPRRSTAGTETQSRLVPPAPGVLGVPACLPLAPPGNPTDVAFSSSPEKPMDGLMKRKPMPVPRPPATSPAGDPPPVAGPAPASPVLPARTATPGAVTGPVREREKTAFSRWLAAAQELVDAAPGDLPAVEPRPPAVPETRAPEVRKKAGPAIVRKPGPADSPGMAPTPAGPAVPKPRVRRPAEAKPAPIRGAPGRAGARTARLAIASQAMPPGPAGITVRARVPERSAASAGIPARAGTVSIRRRASNGEQYRHQAAPWQSAARLPNSGLVPDSDAFARTGALDVRSARGFAPVPAAEGSYPAGAGFFRQAVILHAGTVRSTSGLHTGRPEVPASCRARFRKLAVSPDAFAMPAPWPLQARFPARVPMPETHFPAAMTDPAPPRRFGDMLRTAWGRVPVRLRLPAIAALALLLMAGLIVRWGPAAQARSMQAIRDRAAFEILEDFRAGLRHWRGATDWVRTREGVVETGRLALLDTGRPLRDYDFEFLGQVKSQGFTWVYRAVDDRNYYAGSLVVRKPGPVPEFALKRYAVIAGVPETGTEVSLPRLMRNDSPYRVQVRVKGDGFATYVEGQQVDYWTDGRLKAGTAGFGGTKDERAYLYWVKISYHNDWLGRLCASLAPGDRGWKE